MCIVNILVDEKKINKIDINDMIGKYLNYYYLYIQYFWLLVIVTYITGVYGAIFTIFTDKISFYVESKSKFTVCGYLISYTFNILIQF